MRVHLCVLAIASVVVVCANARAQGEGGNIDLQGFRPAMDSRGFITLDGSQVLGRGELSFGLVTNWGRRLLRFQADDRSYEVRHIVTPTVVGAVGVRLGWLQLELGASVPFGIMAGDRDPDTPRDENPGAEFGFDGQGLGDIGLHGKWRWLNTSTSPLGVALIASARLPTASASGTWLGGSSLTARASIAVDGQWDRWRVGVNAGVRIPTGGAVRFEDSMPTEIGGVMPPTTAGAIEAGKALPFGVAASYAVVRERFDVVAELFGAAPLEGENYFPLEAVGGAKLYLARNSFLTFGGGAGVLSQGGNPDLRAFVGIVFEPNTGDRDRDGLKDDVDQCPDAPEDFDGFEDEDGCPEMDNDHDGIPDTEDACPNEPEDRDGFDDEDGCPDADRFDRDGDGILDDTDECPDEPEDYDDFEDADGCPDVNNDRDRILDIDDLCPDDPEDVDRFEDRDGCPDPDNDRDLIRDVDDECPGEDGMEPPETQETYNNIDDDDGCPDGRSIIGVDTSSVVLREIHFELDSAEIKDESHPILEAVAGSLMVHTTITRVEIQGHTDERGSDAYNLDLSQRRAESVRRFLIERGVEPGRLIAQGYGERAPVDPRSGQQAWAKNRRVEFLVLERREEP